MRFGALRRTQPVVGPPRPRIRDAPPGEVYSAVASNRRGAAGTPAATCASE